MKFWHGWWVVPDIQIDDFDNWKWCEEMFGPGDSAGRWFWASSESNFYFKNKGDALMFVLRWA